MSAIRLHGYFRSSATWRVRIALHHKQLAYQTVPVHLVANGGEQHSDAYRALNPMREVPALEIDGLVLTQSLPILEYLEETRPAHPLLPGIPADRAHARRIAEVINAGIQPVQNLRVLHYVEKTLGAGPEGRQAWAAHWIRLGFEGLEAIVAQTAGTYCVGDAVSIADVCLVPQVYNARRFAVDLTPFPTLVRIEAALVALPAFVAAAPDVQPDAQ